MGLISILVILYIPILVCCKVWYKNEWDRGLLFNKPLLRQEGQRQNMFLRFPCKHRIYSSKTYHVFLIVFLSFFPKNNSKKPTRLFMSVCMLIIIVLFVHVNLKHAVIWTLLSFTVYIYLVSSRSGRDTELQPIKGGSLQEMDDLQDESQDKVRRWAFLST